MRSGLPPQVLDRAFPFHVVVDGTLAIRQFGPSLSRIAPDVRAGAGFASVFEVARSGGTVSREQLLAMSGQLVLLTHRASGTLLRGQFEPLAEPGHLVFLGSPWFQTAAALEAAGLSLDDFAPHDAVGELLVIGQTQQMAMDDLELLAERLGRQREDLRRTESLYREAIAAANAVPYGEDFLRDRFTHLGDGIERLTGYPAAELTPSALRRHATDDGEDLHEDSAATMRGARPALRRRRDYPIRTRDGELRWVTDASVVITDEAGNATGAIGILEDITARKRAEQRLRESQDEARRLALVAARTDNAVILTDVARRIEWVNAAFTRITGYELDEVRGRSPGSFLQGTETDERTVARVRDALDAARGVSFEIVNYDRNGRRYWVDVEIQPMLDEAGGLTGFMAIEADVTARKHYEERLARLSGELDTILKLVPDGVVAFDASGRVSYCNPAFERMTGVAGVSIRGSRSSQLDKLLAASCEPGQAPIPIEAMSEDESDVLHLARPRPTVIARTVREIRGAYGNPAQRVLYLRDVTRETEIDRMKSEFLSVAAHELRTPMSSVHGFAELLVTRRFDEETSRSIAQTIHRQSSLLVQMVNELLDLARIESRGGLDFVVETQPLGPIVESTVAAMLVPGDPRKVALLDPPALAPKVRVDAVKLRQAITNVLANAYKYSRGKGEIRLSLPRAIRHGRAEIGVRVQDGGVGMTAEQVGRVFERFYRADPSSGIPGTGLGMTLVKEILEIMGGSVAVESEPGAGTTVTLWLPQVEDEAP